MLKEITCITCPAGCALEVTVTDGEIRSVRGNICAKGKAYAWQEVTHPMRNIASSVLVKNGEQPLVSVRLDKPVPKQQIFNVMSEIKKAVCTAPVAIGDVILKNVCKTGSNVIITKHVSESAPN